MPAASQKDLQISFALDFGDGGDVTFLTLPIKPEELTRTEPSRTSIVQSLDGAWVDAFGRGLTTLTISGHTGWGGALRPNGGYEFERLRDHFIHFWHDIRRERIANGQDPNDVRLIFIDPLNGKFVGDVVPTNFVLRRSKNQPLLYLYNISMTVVREKAVNPHPQLMDAIPDATKIAASIKSINENMGFLEGVQEELGGLMGGIGSIGTSVLAATKDVFLPAMKMAQNVINTANKFKQVLDTAQSAVVNIAGELAATATKMWDAVASVATIPAYLKSKLMQVKGAFSGIGCALKNGFADAMARAAPVAAPYGASNCSSTGGGSPSAEPGNPFASVVTTLPILATAGAMAAVVTVKAYDMVEGAINQGLFKGMADKIRAGVSFASQPSDNNVNSHAGDASNDAQIDDGGIQYA